MKPLLLVFFEGLQFVLLELHHDLPGCIFGVFLHCLLKRVLDWQKIGELDCIFIVMWCRVNRAIIAKSFGIGFFDDGHEGVASIGNTAEEGRLIRRARDLAVNDHISPLLLDEQLDHIDAVF